PLTACVILLLRRRESLPMRSYARQMWRGALAVGALSPVAYVLVLYAMGMAPLSQIAPMREVSMLFAAYLGGSRLAERNPHERLLGAACIAAGVIAIAFA